MSESLTAVDVDAMAAAAIAEALQAFAKALRANQLYLPNNPTRQRATEFAKVAFASVWARVDRIRLEVRETELLWEGQSVYRDLERGTEALPFLLHRDGLREIEIFQEFENDDLASLLDLVQRAKSAQPDEDDLVTLLWVADLHTVHYRHVEVGGDSDLPSLSAGESGVASASPELPQLAAIAAESAPPGDGAPPALVRIDEFDSTLYFLEPSELQYLKNEVSREYTSNAKCAVISILFDIIELQTNESAQLEALALLESWLVELIANAEYDLVVHLLHEASETVQRAPLLDSGIRNSLTALPMRLSAPKAVAQLLQALDETQRGPSVETLDKLLSALQATALPTLLAWLTAAASSPVRGAVERCAMGLVSTNTAELSRLLEHGDDAIVRAALRLAARLKSPATVPGLGKVLGQTDSSLRAEAVAALGEIGSSGALQTLERAIDDSDRDVRVAAYRAVANNRHANALPRLAAALRRKDLQQTDLAEKMTLFEAFGVVCGEGGVSSLDAMLNGRSLLRYRESSDIRACAARALGIVGSAAALASLRKSAHAKDLVVRSAVQRAARGNA
ncbi:MAG: HEAT repeat domain-containing protein [Gemmatimonadota bacterium]|nr:HEAT repeat domain-containing protein [Gemmatimonadota bacterium]